MIVEHATLNIKVGMEDAFESAMATAGSIFDRADGFRSLKVLRSVETESSYVLALEWETLEDHTVTFRESGLLDEWRQFVGGFLAGAPVVGHFEDAGGFDRH